MKRIIAICGTVLVLGSLPLGQEARAFSTFTKFFRPINSTWVFTESLETGMDPSPLVNIKAGDSYSSGMQLMDPGVECWASITRPSTSTITDQGAVANDAMYHVTWSIAGPGTPAPMDVTSTGNATAIVYAGTSALLNPGGDFAAIGISVDLGVSANTDGHSAQWTSSYNPVSIIQHVAEAGTVTTSVRVHPTAGVTKPGDYWADGIVTWSRSW